ncbi:MAG: hypothetical protein WC799_14085 [Desulfobacteraceae bacterium]|jgi:hypothetical protein
MNNTLKYLLSFVILFTITGCTGHLVRIKGERLDTAFERIKPGSTIYVVEKNNLNLPEMNISCKKEALEFLVSHGFKASDYKTADYYLALGYNLNQGKETTENVQVMINYSDFNANSGVGFSPINPSPMSMKNVRSTFEVSISAKLIDANFFKQTHQIKEIWRGKAKTNIDYPGTFEKTLSLMLPIVLEKINENVDAEILVRRTMN